MMDNRAKKMLKIYMLGLFLLLAIRDICGFDYNKFILVGYVCIFFGLVPSAAMIPMMTFIFPLLWGLPYTYILPVILCIYLLKKRRMQREPVFFILLFCLLEITASFWYPEIDIAEWIKYFSIVAVFFILLYERDVPYELAVRTFFAGCVVLILVIIVSTIQTAPSNWLSLFAQGWFRFGQLQVDESSGMTLKVNSNSMAYYSLTGLSLGLVLMKKEFGIRRYIIVCLTILLGVGGLLTVSRSWMLFMALILFLYVGDRMKSVKAIVFMVVSVFFLLLAGYYAILKMPELLAGFLTRWTSSDIATGNERLDLLIEYHEIFMSNVRFWFMGTGVTGYKPVTGIYHSFHNAVQQIFVCYGIPCAVIFLTGMLKPVLKVRKRRLALVDWIPFIAVVGFTQTIQFINPEALMLPYIPAVFVIKDAVEKSTGENNRRRKASE